MEWELCKENYQPLRAGRKAATEEGGSVQTARNDAVEAKRRAFWKEIAEYDGEDPLEVWLRFVKWVQQTFTAGGHQSELVPLLERCTRELQGREEYREDVRYLRVWLQYADCLPEPRDVFNFLRVNNIGQGFSMYYESHATYLELRGNFKRAEDVYTDGINRRAQPEARLRSKLKAFQHRMEERRKQRLEEEELGPSFEQSVAEARNPLGSLAARSRRGHVTDRRPAAGTAVGLATRSLLAPASTRGRTQPLGTNRAPQPGGLAVFEDGSDGPAQGPAPTAPSHWTQLPTQAQTRKENQPRATTWRGVRAPQRRSLVAPEPSGPLLEVLVDEELVTTSKPPSGAASAGGVPARTLRQRLDSAAAPPGSLAEALLHNPLMLHADGAERESNNHDGSADALAGPEQPKPAAADPKAPVFAWDQNLLVGDDGSEQCVEQARAARRHVPSAVPSAAPPVRKPTRRALGVLGGGAATKRPVAGAAGGLQVFEDKPAAPPPPAAIAWPLATHPVGESFAVFEEDPASPPTAPATSGHVSGTAPALADRPGLTVIGEVGSPALGGGGGPGLNIREDIELLDPKSTGNDVGLGLSIREDTELIDPRSAGNDGGLGLSIREDTDLIGSKSTGNDGGLGLSIREDTELLDPKSAGNGGGSLGLRIREDTELFGSKSTGSDSGLGLSIREDTELLDPKSAGNDGGLGLSIREDTELINPRSAGNDGGLGLSIREDTDLIGSKSTGNDGGLGLSIREDTELLDPKSAGNGASLGLSIREDTELFGSKSTGNDSGLGLSIREDTDLIGSKSTGNDGGLGLSIREDTGLLSNREAVQSTGQGKASGGPMPGRRGLQVKYEAAERPPGALPLEIRDDTECVKAAAAEPRQGPGTGVGKEGRGQRGRKAFGLIAEYPEASRIPEGGDGDDTQMLAFKAAEVNALMDEADNQAEAADPSGAGLGVRALPVEPTVTMATKEALAAINDMFISDLPHEASRRRPRGLRR
eukprot:jgi/Tetstr1/454679/TSEL_041568.t1